MMSCYSFLLILLATLSVVLVNCEDGLVTIVHVSDADVEHPDLENVDNNQVRTIVVRKRWGFVMGAWTILPLLSKIGADERSKSTRSEWYVFLQDETRVNVDKLVQMLEAERALSDSVPSRYASSQQSRPRFLGFAQVDDAPTIVHHFAAKGRQYPLFAAGFAINRPLLNSMQLRVGQTRNERERNPEMHAFAIDAEYEFAQVAYEANGALLENRSTDFCVHIGEQCATWVDQTASFCPNLRRHHPNGGETSRSDGSDLRNGTATAAYECPVIDKQLSLDNVYFAVKTCEQFYKERVRNVLEHSWIRDVRHYDFYAEFGHPSHVVNVEVSNVLQGHCRKTMRILELVHLRMGKHNERLGTSGAAKHLRWLVLADDDTLVNASALVSVLRHFDGDRDPVLVGERYGFGVHEQYGFDYPTGGAAVAISRRALATLRERAQCACAKPDEPDDMRLGECTFGTPLFRFVHSALFHQNTPADYSLVHRRFVQSRAVSFHRVDLTDALAVYDQWLRPVDSTPAAPSSKNTQAHVTQPQPDTHLFETASQPTRREEL